MIGTPPRRGVKSFTVVIAVRPLLIRSSKALVGFLNRAAVRALPIEIRRAGRERSIDPLDRHEVAAVVDDGDHAGRAAPRGLGDRGVDRPAGAVDREGLLLGPLPAGQCGRTGPRRPRPPIQSFCDACRVPRFLALRCRGEAAVSTQPYHREARTRRRPRGITLCEAPARGRERLRSTAVREPRGAGARPRGLERTRSQDGPDRALPEHPRACRRSPRRRTCPAESRPDTAGCTPGTVRRRPDGGRTRAGAPREARPPGRGAGNRAALGR